MLYGAGIRVSELVSIKLSDIDFDINMVKVLGKGRKPRIIPFNDITKKKLYEYLSKRTALFNSNSVELENYVFLNRFGTILTTRSVQRLMENLSKKAGLLRKTTPHTLRHSYATHMLNAGAGIKTIKELLGHSSISTTEKYTHLTTEKLKQVYKKTHPSQKKSEPK